VLIQDTSCGTGDWRLLVSISDAALDTPGRPALAPNNISVGGSAGLAASTTPLTHKDNHSESILTIARPTTPGPVQIVPSTQLVVPPSAFAGQRTMTVTVQLLP